MFPVWAFPHAQWKRLNPGHGPGDGQVLMQQAKISDIGVFVSRIYEARSITKERYGTIKRRMPYFFSVLSDICGLKQKHSG
jgi:hypothetical protein